LTKCTETATNATYCVAYQGRRQLQNWTPYALINVQLNATDTADGNEMLVLRKSHFIFPNLSLAIHICCHPQCHKCTLHTVSEVYIHETGYLLLAGDLKASC